MLDHYLYRMCVVCDQIREAPHDELLIFVVATIKEKAECIKHTMAEEFMDELVLL